MSSLLRHGINLNPLLQIVSNCDDLRVITLD
jgi:hypothetical protein